MEVETLFSQASKAYLSGDLDAALQGCQTLLAGNPRAAALPAILNLKALSLAGKGLMFAAADVIRAAIQLRPEDTVLRHHAARILLQLGLLDEASREAETACALAPKHNGYRYHLAVVRVQQGDTEKAEEIARQCVQKDPAFSEAWLLLSELATERGDRVQAAACLRAVVERNPNHGRAWALIAGLAHDDGADRPLGQALERIRANTEDDANAATATFALADRARRRGDHAGAFALYREANERLLSAEPFALDRWEASLANTISASRAWLDSDRLTGSAGTDGGENLIFILGMPRSGTSLCEQVICSHREVLGGGEIATMEYVAKALVYEGIDSFDTRGETDWLPRMQQAYLESLPPDSARYARVSDKTPRNFERLGLIFRLFPAARVLWCVRHPLDTIISCYFQDFDAGQRFSHRLEDIARMYCGHVWIMRHWLHYFAASINVIEYASLVQNLEATAREMSAFLGLEFDRAMIRPHLNPRAVRTASSQQVRQPVYTSSLNNWRHYRGELEGIGKLLQQRGLLDRNWRSTVLG